MTWNRRYLPPEPALWRGRPDAPHKSSFFQIVEMWDLREQKTLNTSGNLTFAILGFHCDEGVRRNFGRIGAEEGPSALREALAKLPIQKQNISCIDVGNIVCMDGDLEASQAALGEVIQILLEKKWHPILLGGGHEISYGHYQGIRRVFSDASLGMINFDSHFDMRHLLPEHKGSSGTSFLQIAGENTKKNLKFDYNCIGVQHAGNIREVIEAAKKYGTKILWADDLHQGLVEKHTDFIDRIVDENEIIYVSICLDVFASSFAPGVSAIQPLGLSPWHVIPLLRQLAASGKVVSYDIAELSPRYDKDNMTAKLAANLIFEIIHHHIDRKLY
jgi:formiminoglutamase